MLPFPPGLPAAGRPPPRPRGGQSSCPRVPLCFFGEGCGFKAGRGRVAKKKKGREKSRWLQRDCLRGGTGMAQRFSAWLLRHKPPTPPPHPLRKPAQLPAWREVSQLPFSLGECTREYRPEQLAQRTPPLPAKKKGMNALFSPSCFFFFFPLKTSPGDGI